MYDQYLSLYIKYIGDYTRQVVLEYGNIGPVGNMGCSRRTKHICIRNSSTQLYNEL